ncbi:hypothetical protein MRQ47_004473 [Salmonella enterica]|nr:hypothetical protein [Salmonella enterica]
MITIYDEKFTRGYAYSYQQDGKQIDVYEVLNWRKAVKGEEPHLQQIGRIACKPEPQRVPIVTMATWCYYAAQAERGQVPELERDYILVGTNSRRIRDNLIMILAFAYGYHTAQQQHAAATKH